jgi:hypothetical protein
MWKRGGHVEKLAAQMFVSEDEPSRNQVHELSGAPAGLAAEDLLSQYPPVHLCSIATPPEQWLRAAPAGTR